MSKKAILILVTVMIVMGCGSDDPNAAPLALGRALVKACPVVEENDLVARDACADALTASVELRDALVDPILWGGQPLDVAPADLLTDANLTSFNPRIWRRMYLSTFMFESAPTELERSGEYRVLRIPVRFRNQLDAGEYPYPFWHSENKWTAYEQATEVLFVFDEDNKVPVAARTTLDAARPHQNRVWDGLWSWNDGQEPHVTLYSYLFSAANPHVTALDTAYRDLEETMRETDCTMCHDPSNSQMMRHLELLNYPNQALSGRHDVVRMLRLNSMPPVVGIPDEGMREVLIQKATVFAEAGDAALAFEDETLPSLP